MIMINDQVVPDTFLSTDLTITQTVIIVIVD